MAVCDNSFFSRDDNLDRAGKGGLGVSSLGYRMFIHTDTGAHYPGQAKCIWLLENTTHRNSGKRQYGIIIVVCK